MADEGTDPEVATDEDPTERVEVASESEGEAPAVVPAALEGISVSDFDATIELSVKKPEVHIGGGADQASAYVAPRPLPQRPTGAAAEADRVQIADAINPRRLPTMPRIVLDTPPPNAVTPTVIDAPVEARTTLPSGEASDGEATTKVAPTIVSAVPATSADVGAPPEREARTRNFFLVGFAGALVVAAALFAVRFGFGHGDAASPTTAAPPAPSTVASVVPVATATPLERPPTTLSVEPPAAPPSASVTAAPPVAPTPTQRYRPRPPVQRSPPKFDRL